MKPRTLLILTVLVLGLGAFIAFFERDLPSSEEREKATKRVLGSLTTEEVEAVTLEWGDQRVRLVLEKPEAAKASEGEQAPEQGRAEWRLAEPLEARADKTTVGTLLRRLVELEKRRTLEEGEEAASPADLGLEPPRATITLATTGGERVLRLGDEIPLSKDRVATLDDREALHVVDGSVWGEITREPGSWRDKAVLPVRADEITRLELATPDAEPVVIRRHGEQFRLEAPISDLADAGEVRRLTSSLAGLRAQSFLDGPDAEPSVLGLEPPRAAIGIITGGDGSPDAGPSSGASWTLEIGAEKEGESGRYYGRLGGQTFVFQSADLLATLERPAAAWRSPTWSGLEVFRVDGVRVKDAEGELTLSRDGADWSRDGEKIPYEAASELLYAFAGVEAAQLLSPEEVRTAGLALGEPAVTLEVTAEGHPDETLTLYPEQTGGSIEGVPARAGDREVVFLLTAEQRDKLLTAIRDVRSAEMESAGDTPEEGETGSAGGSDNGS